MDVDVHGERTILHFTERFPEPLVTCTNYVRVIVPVESNRLNAPTPRLQVNIRLRMSYKEFLHLCISRLSLLLDPSNFSSPHDGPTTPLPLREMFYKSD